MSTTMSDTTTTDQNAPVVREFMGDKVNFIANDDLGLELRHGGNENIGSGLREEHVLVTINVDDCEYSNVEVSRSNDRTYVDAIDAAIESLIVVRDQLRKIEATA